LAEKKVFSPTLTFLRAVPSVLDALSSGRASSLNSTLALLLGVLTTASAAFSARLWALAVAVVASGLLALIAGKLKEWLFVSTAALAFAASVSAPAVLGVLPAKGAPAAVFIARAVASASLFTAFYSLTGWRGFVEGVRGLGALGYLGDELAFTLRYIPLFTWKTLRLLSAREARLFTSSRRLTWRVVNSVAGSILAGAYAKAYWARLAYTARSFSFEGNRKTARARFSMWDAFLTALSAGLLMILVGVL